MINETDFRDAGLLPYGERFRVLRREADLSIKDLIELYRNQDINMTEKRWRGVESEGTKREGKYAYRPLTLKEIFHFCQFTFGSPTFLIHGLEPRNMQSTTQARIQEVRDSLYNPLSVRVSNDTRYMSPSQQEALKLFWVTFITPYVRSSIADPVDALKTFAEFQAQAAELFSSFAIDQLSPSVEKALEIDHLKAELKELREFKKRHTSTTEEDKLGT